VKDLKEGKDKIKEEIKDVIKQPIPLMPNINVFMQVRKPLGFSPLQYPSHDLQQTLNYSQEENNDQNLNQPMSKLILTSRYFTRQH